MSENSQQSQPTLEDDDDVLQIFNSMLCDNGATLEDTNPFIAENGPFCNDLLAELSENIPDQTSMQASVKIVEQPKRHYVLNFESNLRNDAYRLGGTNSKRNHRSNIKLHVEATQAISQSLQILCAICVWPVSHANSDTELIPEQSSHLLINNATETKRQDSENCKPLLLETSAAADASTCELQLNNFHIIRANEDRKALIKKDEEFMKWFQGRESLNEAVKCAIENKATECLAKHKQNNKETTIRPAIAQMQGSIEIVATAKVAKSHPVTVRIYEEDAGGQLVWEKHVTNVPFGMNKDVKFILPAYDGINSGTAFRINCSIELICEADSTRSKPVKFVYTRNWHTAPPARRRNVNRTGNSVMGLARGANIQKDSIRDIYVDNTDDTSDIESFLVILSQVANSQLDAADRRAIVQAQNEDYYESNNSTEHLLHRIAGSCKNAHFIPDLVLAGGAICAQISNGQTPLHIAIANEQHDCIAKFSDLFENSENHPQVTSELKELLNVYNADGYTTMHLAVLQDLEILVAQMLMFCTRHSIDACAIETLGSGDTILHLAVAKRLRHMEKLIMELIPNADCYGNYAGLTAHDADTEALLEEAKRLSLASK